MASTIYHNPQCSTSRKVLGLLREAGEEPRIVRYLDTPPDAAALGQLIADAGLTVRDAMRRKEPLYKELGLDNEALTPAELLDALAAHPRLLERPFVVTDLGTRLCRPAETVRDILPQTDAKPA